MTLNGLFDVQPISHALSDAISAVIDGKAKPPKSLGRIEELAHRVALIQQTTTPKADNPTLLVFAADHGLTQSGVAAFPAGITISMVDSLLAGRATANAFAKVVGARVQIIDSGVNHDLSDRAGLIHHKVGYGTKNASVKAAMTINEAQIALLRGAEVANAAISEGADLILMGEMGIGNSSSASLIIHRLTNAPLHLCVGPGAGHSEESMRVKRDTLTKAAERTDVAQPMDVLAEFGGFEIAMMAGAAIACAKAGVPVLIDGFICSAAALMAIKLVPAAKDYCIFTHASAEPGHAITMTSLKVDPLLHLDMRLGEGTGALLAVPLIQAACAMMSDVASLAEVMEASA